MVLRHNISAVNSNRITKMLALSQAKSAEKLSSGYRINRGADDASGLSISEKMRKQIRGLSQAALNAQDGISAVQTAEGALVEIHEMLQRMNELSIKAANGTMSEADRADVQGEIRALLTEADRVSETTKFNEIYLLKSKGSEEKRYKSTAVLYTEDGETVVKGTLFGSGAAYYYERMKKGVDPLMLGRSGADNGIVEVKTVTADRDVYFRRGDGTAGQINAGEEIELGTTVYTRSEDAANGSNGHTLKAADITVDMLDGATASTVASNLKITAAAAVSDAELYQQLSDDEGVQRTVAPGVSFRLSDVGTLYKSFVWKGKPDAKITESNILQYAELYNLKNNNPILSFHVGADAVSCNQIRLRLDSVSTVGLGISSLTVEGRDGSNALKAIDMLTSAISIVSGQRAVLGAVQNRLEHTIKNLDNVVENTTASESRIRDTDMSREMVSYSVKNILAQTGQTMLAQANQSGQGVLGLLG